MSDSKFDIIHKNISNINNTWITKTLFVKAFELRNWGGSSINVHIKDSTFGILGTFSVVRTTDEIRFTSGTIMIAKKIHKKEEFLDYMSKNYPEFFQWYLFSDLCAL